MFYWLILDTKSFHYIVDLHKTLLDHLQIYDVQVHVQYLQKYILNINEHHIYIYIYIYRYKKILGKVSLISSDVENF